MGLELKFWLKDRLKEDARHLARGYCDRLGLTYRGITLMTSEKLWGSCTQRGIALNWHLIAAPKSILEYVVLHEVCHLKYRNHSEMFWTLLASQMPDYAVRKKWLECQNPS